MERFLNYLSDEVIHHNGWQIVAVEYRMRGDGAKFPDQLTDCCDAVRYLVLNADKYSINPKKIGVCGSSAGGYAAAMMALETNAFRGAQELAHVDFRVAAVASCSGILDVPECVCASKDKIVASGDGRLLSLANSG